MILRKRVILMRRMILRMVRREQKRRNRAHSTSSSSDILVYKISNQIVPIVGWKVIFETLSNCVMYINKSLVFFVDIFVTIVTFCVPQMQTAKFPVY